VKVKEDGRTVREGDWVNGPRKGEKLGEVLASLDKRDSIEQLKVAKSGLAESEQQVNAARARLSQAEAQQRLANDTFSRNKELFQKKAISRHELDVSRTSLKTAESAVASAKASLEAALSGVAAAQARVVQAKLPLERSSIYAPFDGILTYVNIKKGDYFAPNLVNTSSEEAALKTVPMVIIDPHEFEVTMEIPPFEGSMVKPGQPAIIMTSPNRFPSPSDLEPDSPLQGGAVRGKVFSVSPAVSPGGRSIQVKVLTTEGAGKIKDGMFVTCWIVVDEKVDAVVVPFDVFIYRQNRPYIFVVDEGRGVVEQREVVEGIAGLSTQEILQGVGEGALLVTDGRHRLSNGAPVESPKDSTQQMDSPAMYCGCPLIVRPVPDGSGALTKPTIS
ncbi:MAG: hypothetical protein V1689_05310, partial [Pseudomonadota bacterium]